MSRIQSLVEIMTEREVTLEQLLEATGMDARILHAIVRGQYTPSPKQRQRIASALEVDPAEIAWNHGISVQHVQGHGPQFGRSP